MPNCFKLLYMDEKDLIKELFPFEKPLTSRFRKDYVENLALSILRYCYDGTYDGFSVQDGICSRMQHAY